MSILNQLNEDMKTAMRAKDKDSLTTIRMIKSAIQNEEIRKGSELNQDEEIAIVSREKKQRLESLNEFEKAERDDLVEKLNRELEIVNKYLPEQLAEDEVRGIVNETINEVGAESMQDMGKVMSTIMPKVAGRANGGTINKLVREELSK